MKFVESDSSGSSVQGAPSWPGAVQGAPSWPPFCSSTLLPFPESYSTVQVLLICRRDSLSFIEFVRGKYSISDRTYLYTLLKGMTKAEHAHIRSHTFRQLWDTMWGSSSHTHKNDYDNSSRKYAILAPTLSALLDANPTEWTEPEWGFPKGRKNQNESELGSAVREFQEETNLTRYQYKILYNVEPLSESFTGSNDVSYCHKYYMAVCGNDQEVALSTQNHHMAREIGQIGWFTLDEALHKLRPENTTKRELIQRIGRFARTFYCVE